MRYNSLEEMYAAIGYGGLTSQKAVTRMRDILLQITKQRQEEKQATVPLEDNPGQTRPAIPTRIKGDKGIIVEGLTNCLVKFSRCCTPVPGDKIAGYITRGYGVSVHRADCPNAAMSRRTPEQAGRWIGVSWGGDTCESYPTTLEVLGKDRPNLLVDVSAALSATKTRVDSINARTSSDGFFTISLCVDVKDSDHLKTVMNKIHQISGVMQVTRPTG